MQFDTHFAIKKQNYSTALSYKSLSDSGHISDGVINI